MSDATKYDGAIEEALGLLAKYAALTPNVEALVRDAVAEARAELEAIKQAAAVINADVAERHPGPPEPAVVRAFNLMESIAKRAS